MTNNNSGGGRNTVGEALERLCLSDVWDQAPMAGPAPHKDGMYKSPFRPEERTESFSVTLGGKRFVDFGARETKGGVWQFVAFCHPEWEKREIARFLVERAGLEWSTGSGAPITPEQRKEWRQRKAAESREARERIYRERRRDAAATVPPADLEGVREWPSFVRERFEGGVTHAWENPKKMLALARKRGWPVAWVEWLVEAGLLSFAMESGADESGRAGGRAGRRMVAFPVQFPRCAAGKLDLVNLGYHQRTFWPAKGDLPERRGWEFCPCHPRAAWSNYQRSMVAHAEALGVAEPGKAVIRPYPFLLGNPEAMRLLIVTEGQWDAATIYGAMGAFVDDVWDMPVVVAGVRGASGDGQFFAALGPWIKRQLPTVWVLADNDRAAARWHCPKEEPGKIPALTMVDRLRGLGCAVKVSLLKDGRGGKDFNDYYRERRPETAEILQWMDRMGVLPK